MFLCREDVQSSSVTEEIGAILRANRVSVNRRAKGWVKGIFRGGGILARIVGGEGERKEESG